MTHKWRSGPRDTPKRDLFSIRVIAEVVSRFDVVAIQEVQVEIEALRLLVRALGLDWGLILTDGTKGEAGDRQRLAFVYDARRAKPSGLACELVVPEEWLKRGVEAGALRLQFAKTPYAVAFRSAGTTSILVTLHGVFGEKPQDRLGELRAIARWMREWADDTADEYHQNLLVLGDFNIDRQGDPNYEAFVGQGLRRRPSSRGSRARCRRATGPKFYDEIAWFRDNGDAKLTLTYSVAPDSSRGTGTSCPA